MAALAADLGVRRTTLMIGGPWTREQKAAYRAAFSIGRIGDELWTLIALLWTAICVVALVYSQRMLYVIAAGAGFVALYWLTWQLLLPWLERTMPKELRAALPRGRFEEVAPHAPRTYGELFRRWLAPQDAGDK